MDHPFSTPSRTAFQPWRAAALIAIAVAAAELLALMVAGFALLGRSLAPAGHAKPARRAAVAPTVRHRAPAPRPAPVGAPKLTRARTSVLVLNGNGVAGAAAAASTRVRALHYVLGGVGNAKEQTGPSMIMYRPGYRAEALRLGRDLHVASVGALDGLRASDLHGARLAYVVGSG